MSFCLDRVVETELRAIAGNNVCVDCDARGPQWASVSFGVFMCLECSGRHRALGVHISFVRSVSMDSWTDKQIKIMRQGGNSKFISFLEQYSVIKDTPIARKYNTPAAQLYKDRLLAEVEGRPLPTELPADKAGPASTVAQGSDPLPGETDAEYVARQRKLQAEAKERLRQKFGPNAGSGLTSGGSMQGIGSDPTYRPGAGSGSGSGGIVAPEVAAQVAEVSQKALSFVSSSITPVDGGRSTPANTSSGQATPGPVGGAVQAPLIAPETVDAYKQAAVMGWTTLTTHAVGIWSKATEVVQTLAKPIDEEEESKFPRGTYEFKELPSSLAQSQTQPQSSSNDVESQQLTPSTPNSDRREPQRLGGTSSPFTATVPPAGEMASLSLSRNSSTSAVSLSSAASGDSPSNRRAERKKDGNTLSAKSKSPVAAAPVGDDFFATFGVK